MLDLSAIEDAARRIAPFVRHTPLMQATALREPVTEADLWLKLECLQPTGSFKVRGATNRLLTTPPEALANGIVTASGGNHGLATARAAFQAGVPGIIFVPKTVTPDKLERLRGWGADVRVVGDVWDDANREAQAYAAAHGAVFFHPFADPAVMAGQGTVALEILADMPEVETLLVAIGGGGLISGMASAIRALKPSVRIIGIEPVGSPTLLASRQAGHVVRLPAVTTRVATMACGRTDEAVFAIVDEAVEDIVLVDDEEMLSAAKWLWSEMGLAADLSGAAAIAGIRSGKIALKPGEKVCALVCGAGKDALV